MNHFPAKITVDLDVIENNVREISRIIGSNVGLMAIVKANAYGHGLIPSAHAALRGGATWIGVAKVSEAITLRADLEKELSYSQSTGCKHVMPRIFTWIYGPDAPYEQMIEAGFDLSVSTLWAVEKIAETVTNLRYENTDKRAKIHIKVDTGFGRNGFVSMEDFKAVCLRLSELQTQGIVSVEGIWSHLSSADEVDHPEITDAQKVAFDNFVAAAKEYSIDPPFLHIAASAAVLNRPDMHYNLVRPGILLYGLSPNSMTIDIAQYNLHPAMTLTAELTNVKPIKAGSGISYGLAYHTKQDTNIGIVPIGYADGVFRASGATDEKSGAPVLVNNQIAQVVGRVCMDQFMIDLGPDTTAKSGDTVTLFGDKPLVDAWAKAAGTINYEILSTITRDAPVKYHSSADTQYIPKITEEILNGTR